MGRIWRDGHILLKLKLSLNTIPFGLRFIGVRYRPTDAKLCRARATLFCFSYIALGMFLLIHDFGTLMKDFEVSVTSTGIKLVMWNSQTIICQLFIHVWQRTDAFKAILDRFQEAEMVSTTFRKQRNRSQQVAKFFYTLMASLVPFYIVSSAAIRSYGYLMSYSGTRTELFNVHINIARAFANYLNGTTLMVAVHFFSTFVRGLYWEAKAFNQDLKELKPSDPSKMCMELERLLIKHTQLARTVRCVDKVFSQFAFLMLCANVPTLMFRLIRLMTRNHWAEILDAIPSVTIFVYIYLGLTVAPTQMRSELAKSTIILCGNKDIWAPYDAEVNRLARTLTLHFDQPDLGISLWGFAIVSKPLILTTFSVMLTLLAFFLEFKNSNNAMRSTNFGA
ncbi:unnamed protein product, partial [Mesorhabditis spiculigera]